MARTESSKDKIGEFIAEQFVYNLIGTVSNLRQNYKPSVVCKKTVLESLEAFLESDSSEETIRNTIEIGGAADETPFVR